MRSTDFTFRSISAACAVTALALVTMVFAPTIEKGLARAASPLVMSYAGNVVSKIYPYN